MEGGGCTLRTYTFLSFDCKELDRKYAPGSWYYVACVVIVHVAVGRYSSHMLVRLIPSPVHVTVLRIMTVVACTAGRITCCVSSLQ